ncbi:MAG: prepilin-type N-terminal cleavage/methylation domain-containing protein [Lachnospiraceae bacterium]|nr:prepilin-type N-terminal cleavage/methylation domain-containing protein [Lachnospiraceae bacterium]
MKKLSKDNKGFTLVEMIVVLVILAILAAILIPGLLGYIDDAKNKQLEIHGKAVYTAAQATASKYYAKNKPIAGDKDFAGLVKSLSELSTFGENAKAVVYFNSGSGSETYKVSGISYTESENEDPTVYFKSGKNAEWTTKKPDGFPSGSGIEIK